MPLKGIVHLLHQLLRLRHLCRQPDSFKGALATRLPNFQGVNRVTPHSYTRVQSSIFDEAIFALFDLNSPVEMPTGVDDSFVPAHD